MYLNFQKKRGREAKSEWEKERSVEKRRNINSQWTHKKLHKGKKILPEIDLEAVCEAYENILPEFLLAWQFVYLKNFRNRFYA